MMKTLPPLDATKMLPPPDSGVWLMSAMMRLSTVQKTA